MSSSVKHAVEVRFREVVAKLGGVVVEYVNSQKPAHVKCAEGHDGYPRPTQVLNRGIGICRVCAGNDPATGERKFRTAVAALGGTVKGPYVNARTKVLVACVCGRENAVQPYSISTGVGVCGVCAGNTPAAGEAAFRRRVAEEGAVLLGTYVNNRTKVQVRCCNGHECWPDPSSVNGGQGVCRECAGKVWDVFYVVTGPDGLKFGLTSGDPRPRLNDHARNGYVNVIRCYLGVVGSLALETETSLIRHFRSSGIEPVKGREYYDITTLGQVLSWVDERLVTT